MGEASSPRVDELAVENFLDNSALDQAVGGAPDGANATSFPGAATKYAKIAYAASSPYHRPNLTNFSVSCFVKLDNLSASYPLLSVWDAVLVSGANFILYYHTGDAGFRLICNGTGNNQTVVVTTDTVTAGQWHMVTAYHNGTDDLVGVALDNGDFVTAAHTYGITSTSTPFDLRMGAIGAGSTYLAGDMCKVNFWHRVLTTTDTAELWNSGSGIVYPG